MCEVGCHKNGIMLHNIILKREDAKSRQNLKTQFSVIPLPFNLPHIGRAVTVEHGFSPAVYRRNPPEEICLVKAKIYAISSDTHQLEFIKLHHFKLEILNSI